MRPSNSGPHQHERNIWSVLAVALFLAVVSTQIVATLLAVYGIFMAPIGWKLSGRVCVY
ncbi:MAG: hypothetical protein KDB27_27575 [Planctomycetales bacterium]|nr:hypothetical protein [Planctomycetales bacterium]